jgi:hypothetical protein
MEFTNDLDDLDDAMDKIQKDFDSQMAVISNNSNDFHKQIIALSARHPEQQDIIEFMVFMNDKQETNHTQFRESMTSMFVEFIKNKRTLIISLKRQHEKAKDKVIKEDYKPKELTGFSWLFSKMKSMADVKIILWGGIILVGSLSFLFFPTETLEIIKAIK